MNAKHLTALDQLYAQSSGVIPMKAVYFGRHKPDVIAVRHDVDDNEGSWQTALKMARWEHDGGYLSTYFLLHSASYWGRPGFWEGVQEIASLGHEVGIHNNAIATAIRTGREPFWILEEAVVDLEETLGTNVVGTVAHGDELCQDRWGLRFVNDEIFTECARPNVGKGNRVIRGTNLRLDPQPLVTFGLLYDSNYLPRKWYVSDSGGSWSQPWQRTVEQFASQEGQLHLNIHPDWWGRAF